ncbi:MAG: MlaD family protein [Kiritimatiellae bacterium]|nr:MlaD family protein [Kiritimatiellia bacterium]MDW8458370.1 MlaD family protein [Verrucomicrobiota bacterium]
MKRSRMQQMSIEIVVGFFMMMILLALGFFTIILSQDNILAKNYELTVVFDQVAGLITGDKVYVKGVDVGRVKRLEVRRDGVHALLSLDYPVELREDYSIHVVPASVLGGKFVEIREGSPEKPLLEPGQIVVGKGPADFIAEFTEGIQKIRTSLEQGGVLENLQETMANLREITRRLRDGEGTVGKLLTDDGLYTNLLAISARLERGEGTLGKLLSDDGLYTNLLAVSARLERGEGTLGKLLTDDGLYTNLLAVSARLERGEGTLGRLLSSDDQLYQDLSDAVASLKDTAQTISRGEGTLGKLVKDDGLYRQVDSLIVEVRAAVDDLRETTPVVSFSSIFFGAF